MDNYKSGNTLHSYFDPIGVVLSNWRIHAVSPHIKKGNFIDLACGDNRLVRKLGYGKGIDINNYGHVDIVLPDFTSLPFEPESVDTITILAALNYFDDPIAVLNELNRILKKDGLLIVTFLNKSLSRLWHKFRDRGLPRVAYSESELQSLCKASGLTIHGKKYFMFGVNCIYLIKKECLN